MSEIDPIHPSLHRSGFNANQKSGPLSSPSPKKGLVPSPITTRSPIEKGLPTYRDIRGGHPDAQNLSSSPRKTTSSNSNAFYRRSPSLVGKTTIGNGNVANVSQTKVIAVPSDSLSTVTEVTPLKTNVVTGPEEDVAFAIACEAILAKYIDGNAVGPKENKNNFTENDIELALALSEREDIVKEIRTALDEFRMLVTNDNTLFNTEADAEVSEKASDSSTTNTLPDSDLLDKVLESEEGKSQQDKVLLSKICLTRQLKRIPWLFDRIRKAQENDGVTKKAEFTGMQKVTPYLWIGPYQPLLKRGIALEENGITAVLSVTKQSPNQLPKCVKRRLCLQVNDDVETDMNFDRAIAFVRHEKEQFNGACYVHCGAGISRAATASIACLCEIEKISLNDAMFWVKSVRPFVNPNAGFRKQLIRRYGGDLGTGGKSGKESIVKLKGPNDPKSSSINSPAKDAIARLPKRITNHFLGNAVRSPMSSSTGRAKALPLSKLGGRVPNNTAVRLEPSDDPETTEVSGSISEEPWEI